MIAIKGLRQGILIVFSGDSTPWLSQLFELEKKLESNTNFFKGGKMALDVKGFALDASDIQRAQNLLKRYEVDLWAIVSENPLTQTQVRAAGLVDTLVEPVVSKPVVSKLIVNGAVGSEAVKPAEDAPQEALAAEASESAADPFVIEGTDGLLVKRRAMLAEAMS